MMKSFKTALLAVALVLTSFHMPSEGAATVTASKNYVDRQTTLHPYSNGVDQVGYFLGTQTNKVLASASSIPSRTSQLVNDGTNGVPFALISDINDSRITDGTNTIDAAGNVWISESVSYWRNNYEWMGWFVKSVVVSPSGEEPPYTYRAMFTNESTEVVGVTYGSSEAPVEFNVDVEFDPESAAYIVHVTKETQNLTNYVGKLALTNDIPTVTDPDFTTSNTQLVATIEATAPAPGNYSAVSNAAMNARSMTDLAVYASETTPWTCSEVKASGEYAAMTNLSLWTFTTSDDFDGRQKYPGISYNGTFIGECNSPMGYDDLPTATEWPMYYDNDLSVYFSRNIAGMATDNRLATTSDIPHAVSVVVPSTNATPGTASDAKATGTALYTGFTEWEFSGIGVSTGSAYSVIVGPPPAYVSTLEEDGLAIDEEVAGNASVLEIVFHAAQITATRHLVTPTKTSQLQNDGDGTNQFATVNLIDASNETFSNAVLSVGLGIDTNTVAAINALVESGDDLPIGGAASVGAILLAIAAAIAALKRRVDNKASVDDLPYELVEPGEWEFSGVPNELTVVSIYFDDGVGDWNMIMSNDAVATTGGGGSELSVTFRDFSYDGDYTITATRASLPGHLLDRAVNAVSVTGATTLTLPEMIIGKSRDFYVRLTVSAAGDGSAVTFASTDSGGDAVAWDSMGDPSGTFAEGTYLYRMTESDEGLMHAEDMMALEGVEDALEQINDGTSTPSALDMKLDATSAAPAFDPTLTYIVGEYVTYGGILYRCKIAVTVAGPWTGDSNWVDVDMTSPDATLDVRSDGRLAVVAADSEILWIQGYDMASASDVVLSCEKVNFYAFASGTTTQTFNMPSAPGGKVGDFVLDIDNSANASTAATATLNGFGTSFDVIVPKGQNLFTDILTFNGGEMCELYFTMTAFGTAAKPAWKVVKQVVEKQEAGS